MIPSCCPSSLRHDQSFNLPFFPPLSFKDVFLFPLIPEFFESSLMWLKVIKVINNSNEEIITHYQNTFICINIRSDKTEHSTARTGRMNTIELCRAWGQDEIKNHSGSTGSICDVKKMDDNRIGAADCGTIVASAVNVTKEQENMTTVAEANLNCKEREALLLKKSISSEEALARKHAEEVALCRKKAVKEALL